MITHNSMSDLPLVGRLGLISKELKYLTFYRNFKPTDHNFAIIKNVTPKRNVYFTSLIHII